MNSPPRKKAKMLTGENSDAADENVDDKTERDEQEQVLLALIEHRTKEVERNKLRVTHYTAELEQSKRKLEETKTQLSRLRGQQSSLASKENTESCMVNVKAEEGSSSPYHIVSHSPKNQSHSILEPLQNSVNSPKKSQVDVEGVSSNSHSKTKPGSKIAVPAVNLRTSQSSKSQLGTNGSASVPTSTNSSVKLSVAKPRNISSEQVGVDVQSKPTKRKFVQKEHKDLIGLIGGSSSARNIHCKTGTVISSQHKRKLRSLVLCPTNDQLFVTSALDGFVNLWQLQAKGLSASCLSGTHCSPERKWPEDIAWHPHGNSIFSVFSADGGDSQVSVLDLNKGKERGRVSFLENKPHVKGNINNIMFMPWEDTCFVTGGTDHAVVLWTENDEIKDYKAKALHRNMHSSAVMGVAGLEHKHVVLSAGADKRITGYDVLAGRADYKHQSETKCMSVVPNPCDFNLFMVQTGTIGRQLRLFDYRLRQTEIHAFGWEQETSESQSALINQAWSPDGLYITSGSVDPMIHIFDIRYNAKMPTQSIRAHQKRVFKAVWHSIFPLLISISSDLNIGLHKIT